MIDQDQRDGESSISLASRALDQMTAGGALGSLCVVSHKCQICHKGGIPDVLGGSLGSKASRW